MVEASVFQFLSFDFSVAGLAEDILFFSVFSPCLLLPFCFFEVLLFMEV